MSAEPQYMSFEGTLTRNAEMRQTMCNKQGQLRPAVCLHLLTTTGKHAIHAQQFFADASAAQACAKTLRKGATVTLHMALAELQLSGTADFVEVQAPAPVATTAHTTQAQAPELQF